MTPQAVYDRLYAKYGNLNWWPAKTPYEVIVGAVLTQNTNWNNVEKAIANFGDNLHPQWVLDADLETLREIIRPSGFFNQKSVYLKEVTRWFQHYNFDVKRVSAEPLHKLRPELLAVRGIGMETADSILLYAFGLPTFVIDAYTMRLCERLPLFEKSAWKNYTTLKNAFEANLDTRLYNNYHALIVIHGKNHCRKRPVCEGCPFEGECEGETR